MTQTLCASFGGAQSLAARMSCTLICPKLSGTGDNGTCHNLTFLTDVTKYPAS
ncbi:hypothetical protein [Shimia sp.]|uniref:hypothetical protein n=1 Tax=Shimia sp. TaxID=1954381 RepID=UPI00329880A2